MSDMVQPKGCICEVNFGYDARMEGYTNLSSDISKLYGIFRGTYKYLNYFILIIDL